MTSKWVARLSAASIACLIALLLGYLTRQTVHAQAFVGPGRINYFVTVVTAGTPVRVTTNTTLIVDRCLFQAAAGASVGLGYLCTAANGTTPTSNCGGSGQLAAEFAPATATAPGSAYSDTIPSQGAVGIAPSLYWLDNATSGAAYVVSCNVR